MQGAAIQRLRVIVEGAKPGPYNMAIDQALLLKACANGQTPVMRFYSWSSPTVSVGYHQDIAARLNLTECRRRGVDIVRRPTGGREVLHLGELTYSFSISTASLRRIGDSFRSTMELMGKLFSQALERLGVGAHRIQLGRAQKGSKGFERLQHLPCLAALSQYEVSVDGRKLIGSAQKRLGGAFLQHGSIPLSSDGLEIVALLKKGPQNHSSLKKALRQKTTSLGELLHRELDSEELISVLKKVFSGLPNLEPTDSALDAEELGIGLELQRNRYQSSAWYYPANENLKGRCNLLLSEEVMSEREV